MFPYFGQGFAVHQMLRRGNVYFNEIDLIRLGVIQRKQSNLWTHHINPISHVHHHVEKGADLALYMYSHAIDIHID